MARKAVWKEGELFAVPLEDGLATVGQVLSVQKRALNSVVCAFSLLGPEEVRQQGGLRPKDVISIQFVTRDLLDCGAWKVFQSEEVLDFHPLFDLQSHIDRRFIGTKIIGSGNIEDFLAACHGLKPWNGYADLEYLDKLLIAPDRKPGGVRYE